MDEFAHNAVSIIIPIFQEVQNLPELVRRIAALALTQPFEVIFVDDNSRDGTTEVVKLLQSKFSWLHLIVRQANKGLSASVLEGFQAAQYPNLIAMDGDLSHPPEKIPALLAALNQADTDFVIGSRYILQGSIHQAWSLPRKLTSKFSAAMTRLILGQTIHDPLSGFFAVKKSTLQNIKLNPIGWKIGLEIMVKCNCRRIMEIPIHFGLRYKGKSKLNMMNMFANIRHLQLLAFHKLFQQKKS